MFDIGASELLLIGVVICLVIDPKKVPIMVREVRSFYEKFTKIKESVINAISDACDSDLSTQKKTTSDEKDIIGDDGMLYRAHDVNDLQKLKKEKKVNDSENTGS